MAELIVEQPRDTGDYIELAAEFLWSSGSHRLWYRVEKSREKFLAVNADPFVLGTVHLAMQTGEDVRVRGAVSPSLLRNLEAFQRAWSTWKPREYRPVRFRASDEREPDLGPRHAAISSFTGGVDSCFTAYRHTRGVTTSHPLPLRASIMVHGFDIPIDDAEGYRRASEKAERQLSTLGLELYRVASNFRKLPVNWVNSFGAAVASALALFQGGFDVGLIASGIPFGAYQNLVEGENPVTNHLLSSNTFRISGDGAGFQRTEKIGTLAAWPEGLKDLRVCAVNSIKYENCGVCEKCIRNILSFRVLGLGLPSVFPKDVTDEQILGLVPLKEIKLDIGYDPILREAEARDLENESWVRALKKTVRLSRVYHEVRRVRGGARLWKLARVTGLLK